MGLQLGVQGWEWGPALAFTSEQRDEGFDRLSNWRPGQDRLTVCLFVCLRVWLAGCQLTGRSVCQLVGGKRVERDAQ